MEALKQQPTWDDRQKVMDEVVARLRALEHNPEAIRKAETLSRKLGRITPEDLLRRFTI